MIAEDIATEDNLRVIFDDAAIDDLLLAAEINGAVSVHSAAVDAGDPLAEMEAATVLLELLGRLTKPARALILQNRDRSTPAMIAQMTQIASGPDYYRVAPTKEFASGTPIVFGNDNMLPPRAAIGRKDKAVAANGQRFAVRYVVVEAGDILTSNKADGTAIPSYEGGAHGKLRAIAGNGRLAGLIEGFERGTTSDYVRELAEDDAHGIAPEAIAKFARPVLVRVMQQEDVTENIGDISNQKGTSDLSPVEQAQNDSKRLNLSDLDINDDGSASESAALAFIAAMPESERNNLMDGKRPGQKAYDRLMATVFWKAYGDAELVRLYAQSVDPEVKTILGGMASAAGDLAKLDGAGELDIRGLISEAAALAVNAKRQGVKLTLFAQQADMTLDPDTMNVVRMFAENIRSAKKIGERLRAAARFAYEEFTKEGNDMFGEVEKASRSQVLAQLEKPVEVAESSLFDAAGELTVLPVPANPMPQPTSWLGFKIVNQATVDEAAATVLPGEHALSGQVWLVLHGADGEPMYIAGVVVAATFTTSKVKYSVAFVVAPQPVDGLNLYAVVDNIESELLVDKLPDDLGFFDSVLTEATAKLFADPDGAIYDAIDPLVELELSTRLIARTTALQEAGEDDPLAVLAISGEIIAIIKQLEDADVPDAEPAQADPLASAKFRLANDTQFKRLTADFARSLAVIKGVDEGTERGWDRSLFVSSIVGKIKTQAKNDPELAGMLLAWLDKTQGDWKKPAITARNGVWSTTPDWGKYKPLFGGVAPAKTAPQPVVTRSADFADTGEYDVTAPDGKVYQIYRNPGDGWWYQGNTGRHFSEDVVGFTKDEAVAEVVKRAFQRPAPVAAPEPAPIPEAVAAALEEPAAAPAPAAEQQEHATEAEGRAALAKLKPFMPRGQYSAIQEGMNGEEAEFFFDKMVEMAGIIAKMPKTYETRDLGNKGIVSLHYFRGNSDWYITEKDMEGKGTVQAYGFTILNGDRQNAEMGYISIDELVQHNVELDLYWDKKPLSMVRNAMDDEPKQAPAAAPSDPVAAAIAQAVRDPFSHEAWTLPTALVQGMAETDYAAIIDALTADNYHSEVLAMQAARSGSDLWHREALALRNDQLKAGSLTPELRARSDALSAKIRGTADQTVQSEQFESYRAWIEKEIAEFRAIPKGMIETIFADERLNDGEADELGRLAAGMPTKRPEPAPEPTTKQDGSMETLIKIAADSIAQLRRIDVYRVLNSAGDRRESLATYIIQNRPDLQREVLDVMAEEWPDLGYSAPAAPATAPASVEHAELLTPAADGAPKELEVPPIPPEAKSEQERNPARAADMAFLNGVVAQNVDMWDDDLADKIEKLGTTYAGDTEAEALWGKAIESYTNFMVDAMSKG